MLQYKLQYRQESGEIPGDSRESAVLEHNVARVCACYLLLQSGSMKGIIV